MASLRRKVRSPFWFACFTDADGSRAQRSTKQSDRRKGQAVANQFERAAKLGSEKRLGEAQARRVLSDIYEIANNVPLASATAREFLLGWAEKRKTDTSKRTHDAYAQVAREFIASLGDRADRDVSQIAKADVAKYRDEVAARTSVSTANKLLKYLRVALGAAFKDGLAQDNPAAKLDVLKRRDGEQTERRAFTVAEIKTLLEHASDEWKGLIFFGLYTGQRLKDVAGLTWRNVDLEAEVIRFVTGKTGRQMDIPIGDHLLRFVETMPSADDPAAPLFPESFPIAISENGDSRLSQEFHQILFRAGMAKERSKEPTGMGRARRRNLSAISYHSLRHTATSLLKNAGVAESVAMDIIGHNSKAISRHYTHVDEKTKRKAINKLPHLTG